MFADDYEIDASFSPLSWWLWNWWFFFFPQNNKIMLSQSFPGDVRGKRISNFLFINVSYVLWRERHDRTVNIGLFRDSWIMLRTSFVLWLNCLEYIDYLWNWEVDMHVVWMRKINSIAIQKTNYLW